MKTISLLAGGVALVLAIACGGSRDTQDPTYGLTGTEELPLVAEDGTLVCPSPKKVFVCHIPPGNPANAHTICVAQPAVKAHSEHHGDAEGACPEADGGVTVPEDNTDAGTTDSGSDAGTTDPQVPVIN